MEHTYQYYNNTMCVEGGWLHDTNGADVMSKGYFKKLCATGILKTMRRACKGTPSLKAWSSIPPKYQAMLIEKFGNPYKEVSQNLLEKLIQPDPQVAKYFSQYLKPNGSKLKPTKQRQLTTNAEILNAIKIFLARRKRLSASLGKVKIQKTWEQISDYVNDLDTDIYKFDLPTSWRRLREKKYEPYIKFGPETLIHKNVGNDLARKVTAKLENLIISLYCQPEKPYTTTVTDEYLKFLGGAFSLADVKTGELFEPSDFYNEDGQPIMISESTVWNYLNDPKNAPVIAKHRSGAESYRYNIEPHHHRHAPTFSLSKISMDDRDLPRKMHNGKRLKAYYAYDVASGVVIGASYAIKKDTKLFIDCMRNMFQFLNRNEFGIPMEVEVEHHLVNTFKNDLMKAQNVFPFVRWCLAGNSQEKWAETGNRVKKLGYEKKKQVGIGRFYSKSEAHRTENTKVFDEENNTYKFKAYFKEDLIADDLQTIEDYNNDLHSNQKLYKGMTRMDVLKHHLNPNLAQLDHSLLAKYIGNSTQTTIVRNQYLSVKSQKYFIPSVDVLERLAPNNYTVQAHYIPNTDKTIDSVFIYQNEDYICECKPIETYNTAKAEWTEKDEEAYKFQAQYVKDFRETQKQRKEKVLKLKKIPKTTIEKTEAQTAKIVAPPKKQEMDIEALLASYSSEETKKQALNDL